MRHARAWVEINYPDAITLEAGKRVKRFPVAGPDPTVFAARTVTEDLFGVFDLAIFPPSDLITLVQVTTIAEGRISNVSARKKKVKDWVVGTYGRTNSLLRIDSPPWIDDILIIGWVPKKHFRVFGWMWSVRAWMEIDTAKAPLKRAKRVRNAPAVDRSGSADPFA